MTLMGRAGLAHSVNSAWRQMSGLHAIARDFLGLYYVSRCEAKCNWRKAMSTANNETNPQQTDLCWQIRALVEQLSLEERLGLFHPLMLSLLLGISRVGEIDPVWPDAARAFVEVYQTRTIEPKILPFRRP